MRNRIFAVLAIAVLAGGGLAYGTYNMMNNAQATVVHARRRNRSSWPTTTCRSAPS